MTQNEQTKTEVDNIRTLITGFFNCSKTNQMNCILIQKREPVSIITKSQYQYPNIKAQTSDEIQPLKNYENSTVVFGDMLLSRQENNFDQFFTRGRHKNFDIYYTSQSYFQLPRNTVLNNSKRKILFKQTLRGITLFTHDRAGLDIKLEEWKQLCHKVWENVYEYLQIDRFAKIGDGFYTIRNCDKNTYIECTPETEPF